MTLREAVSRCEAYEYSSEYFNLLRECFEVELMDRYISSSQFMESNPNLITSLGSEYFVESTNLEYLQENVNKKKEGALSKIFNGLKRVLTILINFFKRLVGKIRGDKKMIKEASRAIDVAVKGKNKATQEAIVNAAKKAATAAAGVGITFLSAGLLAIQDDNIRNFINQKIADSSKNKRDAKCDESSILSAIYLYGKDIELGNKPISVATNRPVFTIMAIAAFKEQLEKIKKSAETNVEEAANELENALNMMVSSKDVARINPKAAKERWKKQTYNDPMLSQMYELQLMNSEKCMQLADTLMEIQHELNDIYKKMVMNPKNILNLPRIATALKEFNNVSTYTIKCYDTAFKTLRECADAINAAADVMDDDVA